MTGPDGTVSNFVSGLRLRLEWSLERPTYNLGLIDWRSSIHIRARSRARAGHVAKRVAEQVASSEPARRQRSAYVTSQRREQGDGGGTQGQDSHSQGLLHSLFSAIQDMQAQIGHRGEPLDELNLTVPLDMKQKIWDGKFVEMSDLRRKGSRTEEKAKCSA